VRQGVGGWKKNETRGDKIKTNAYKAEGDRDSSKERGESESER